MSFPWRSAKIFPGNVTGFISSKDGTNCCADISPMGLTPCSKKMIMSFYLFIPVQKRWQLIWSIVWCHLRLIEVNQNQNWTKLFASFLKRCFISFGVSLKYFLYTSEILILKTSKWPIFVNWWIHFTKISHLSVKTYKACNISIFFFSFRRLSFIIFLNFSNWFYLSIR